MKKRISQIFSQISRRLMRLLVRFHYPRIAVEGKESLNGKGPFLFLANHANSLIDPVVIGIATGQPVHYLAKAPLFKTPILGPIMQALGMIPAFRGQDDRSQVKRNIESLEAAAAVLAEGRSVGLFPEGKSHDRPGLEPVKSGAARIAVLAHEKGATGLLMIPIGLNYENKEQFRSSIWVRIGEPIPVADWLARNDGQAKKTTRALTAEVETRLREMVTGLDDPEWAPIVEDLEAVLPPSRRRLRKDPIASLRQRERIANAINYFAKESPAETEDLAESLLQHRERLAEHGLSLDSPAVNHRSLTLFGLLFLMTVRLALGVIPVVLGTLHHILPFTLVRWLNARYSRKQAGRTTVAMMRLVYGVPIYGITYLGVWWGLAEYFMPWIATVWTLLAPFAGLYALSYWPALRRTAKVWRNDFALLFQRDKLIGFRRDQKELKERLRKLAVRFEEFHAPLPEPPPIDWRKFYLRTIVRFAVLATILGTFLWINSVMQNARQPKLLTPGPDLANYTVAALEVSLARDEPALREVLAGIDELRGEVAAIQQDFLAGKRDFYRQADNDAIRRLMLDYLNYRSVLLRLIWKYQNYPQIRDPRQRELAGLICVSAATSLYEASLGIIVRFQGERDAIRKLNEAEPLWNISAGMFDQIRRNLLNSEYRERLELALAEFQSKDTASANFAGDASRAQLRQRISRSSQNIDVLLPQLKRASIRAAIGDAVKTGKSSAYRAQSAFSMFVSRLRVRDPRDDGASLIEPEHVRELEAKLRPGDLIIQRRNWALSNAFMPGYWSHVAIYIGTPEQLTALGLADDSRVQPHWEEFLTADPHGHRYRIIEAIGEGVIFTTMEHSVGKADGACVYRPRLTDEERIECLAKVFLHVGKPYDFKFDFFSTDKLVCTELVYRTFGEKIPLQPINVMGRRTLPAMELLRQYMEAPETASRVSFIAFLDGNEAVGYAAFRDLKTLRESMSRPSFQF